MMRHQWKLVVVLGAVIAVGALLASGLRGGTTYYLTVDEALAREAAQPGQRFRIAGTVAPGSVDWQPSQFRLAFVIQDEHGRVPVVYQGVRPDSFGEHGEVIVEGRFQGETFHAETLLVQCASKYEAGGERPEDHPATPLEGSDR